jgi:hypothetical protein
MIKTPEALRRFARDGNRLYKGGASDDSAEQAAADEASKQAARDAVNRIFGIGTNAPKPIRPTLEQFTTKPTTTSNPVQGMNAILGSALTPAASQNLATVNMPAYKEAMRIYEEKMANYKPNNVIRDAREAQYKDAADAVYKFNTDY